MRKTHRPSAADAFGSADAQDCHKASHKRSRKRPRIGHFGFKLSIFALMTKDKRDPQRI